MSCSGTFGRMDVNSCVKGLGTLGGITLPSIRDPLCPDILKSMISSRSMGSLYEVFEPSEARRIAKRMEFHYTPKHGSWLNMAEIEISIFSRQCFGRRIGINSDSEERFRRWREHAMRRIQKFIGNSLLGMLVSNSIVFTHQFLID